MRLMSLYILIAAAFVSATALVGKTQQPTSSASSTPVTTLNIQAREVLLPVTVRDKKGQVIPNLKQSDFVLEQDGRPQTIKSFSQETTLPFRLGLLVDRK